MDILKTGHHLDVPEHIYHADPCPEPSLSSGAMGRLLNQSPLHAQVHHPRLNDDETVKDEESNVLDAGVLAHAMLLGGLERIVAVDPKQFPAEKTGNIPEGWTNKAIKAERDRIRALGKVPVFQEQYDRANIMAERAYEAIVGCEIDIKLAKGVKESTLIWQEDTGIWCRARPDWVSDDRHIMLDYKSTAGLAKPDFWIRRQMGPLGYGLQSVHYRRGGEVLFHERPEWLFLVQENYPPYACAFVGISEPMDEILEQQRKLAYAMWLKHTASRRWPGYGNRIAYATPTSFQMEQHEIDMERIIELAGQA